MELRWQERIFYPSLSKGEQLRKKVAEAKILRHSSLFVGNSTKGPKKPTHQNPPAESVIGFDAVDLGLRDSGANFRC